MCIPLRKALHCLVAQKQREGPLSEPRPSPRLLGPSVPGAQRHPLSNSSGKIRKANEERLAAATRGLAEAGLDSTCPPALSSKVARGSSTGLSPGSRLTAQKIQSPAHGMLQICNAEVFAALRRSLFHMSERREVRMAYEEVRRALREPSSRGSCRLPRFPRQWVRQAWMQRR